MANIRQVGERVFLRPMKGSGIEIDPAQGRLILSQTLRLRCVRSLP